MNLTHDPFVSVLIPARQSAHCLRFTVESLTAYLDARCPGRHEVIIICNGNQSDTNDGTLDLASHLAQEFSSVKCIQHRGSAGKGIALKTGFQAAKGDWIFFVDADLPYDLSFFDDASKRLLSGFDLVTGNRRFYESVFEIPVPHLRYAHKRHRLGQRFNSVVRFFLRIHSTDTQCGIKAMTRVFAEEVFARQTCPGFLFDLEIFMVKQGCMFSHFELPVRYTLREAITTVRLTKDFFEVVFHWLPRLFYQKLKGRYNSTRGSANTLLFSIIANRWRVGLGQRMFLLARWILTPYKHMLPFLPETGEILDLCCGHGLFSVFAALQSRTRKVIGVDHDEKRISSALNASSGIANLNFESGDLRDKLNRQYEGIVLLDSFHYFEKPMQEEIAKKIFSSLKPGGVFLMREMDPYGGLASFFNRNYERFAVKSGFTRTRGKTIENRSLEGWSELLQNAGFEITAERCSSVLFADTLFVCRKPGKVLEVARSRPWVTADDWGLTPAINEGILLLAELGVIRRVSVMANSTFLDYKLDELKKIPDLEIGLHLDFTSELPRPNGLQFSSPLAFLFFLYSPRLSWKRKHAMIETETERQLKALEKANVQVSYMDSHHHIHILPGMIDAIGLPLRKRKIRRVRLPYDPSLWLSFKFPLNILSVFAQRAIILSGFDFLPCFYPQGKLINSPLKLERTLRSKSEHEVIVHPAKSDDLEEQGIRDTYRAERVTEFQNLKLRRSTDDRT